MRMIKAVAVLLNKKIYQLPPPARHHDVMHHLFFQGIEPHEAKQRFVDYDDKFLSRKQAFIIAEKAGQIINKPVTPWHGLFSEDLW